MEIAVYGKGGIGKSTVSANLSAALALAGSRVLQIGCDPKHDSTRLLMHGESIPTVLDYLKTTTRGQEDVDEVLKTGFLGTGCIEAGGPKPGVGCAGRGIISAFEFLDRHHVKEQYSTVIYDVLGDVVCGGFAVPVRREYADAVFLVTSGEYMALYAANNILRGIRNFDGYGFKRVAGIIFNERKLPDEGGRVSRFAAAVGLPVCARVPRSAGFSDAEERNLTLMEMEGYEAEKAVFRSLASHILSNPELYAAHPLEDEELESVVLKTGRMTVKWMEEPQISGGNAKPGRNDTTGGKNALSAAVPVSLENDEPEPVEAPGNRLPLYGCAFNGVATQAVHLTDALVIAHSPRACAFYTWQNISSTGRKNLFNRGILMPSSISPNFECTDMGHSEVVFGGMEKLREYVSEGISRGYSAVVVVSSCTSGIIGDDIRDVEELSTPGCPVITIAADGDIAGDYMEGIRLCMETLAGRLIDPEVKPEGRKVNLINEGSCLNNGELNHRIMESMLGEMGISINCRFLGDATVDEMRHFLAAPLNILADDGEDGRKLAGWLSDRYGCSFLEGGFPVGFASTESFLRKVGAFFDCGEAAEVLIERNLQEYRARVGKLRPLLSGKRILMTTINIDLDWIIEAAHDVGMEFVWIGVLNYLRREICVTKHPDYCAEISEYVDWQLIHEKIEEQKPDIVLTNYTSAVKEGAYFTDAVPMTPVVGFHSALHLFERWAKLMAKQGKGRKGGWRGDKALFEKYYG